MRRMRRCMMGRMMGYIGLEYRGLKKEISREGYRWVDIYRVRTQGQGYGLGDI